MALRSINAVGANYTGMWWDPVKLGMGIYIEHLEFSNCMCGAWYLYDETGAPFWTTFWGKIVDDRLVSDLYAFTGPSFGTTWDSTLVKGVKLGEVTFVFNDTNSISMDFQVKGVAGSLNLVMFSLPECPGWLWWDPNKPGQGVVIFPMSDIGKENEELAVVWYTYDNNGRPVWYTSTGRPMLQENLPVHHFTGPRLGTQWNVKDVLSEIVGSVYLSNVQKAGVEFSEVPTIVNRMSYSMGGTTGNLILHVFLCDSLCQ